MKLAAQTKLKLNIGIIAILSLMVLFFSLPFLLLTDRFLTVQLQTVLQKALKNSGLKLEIGNIHWETWNGLLGTQVIMKDNKSGQIIIAAEHIRLRFNPLALIFKIQTPEAAVTEVLLMHPRIEIRRSADNTWNLQHYFKEDGRRLMPAGVVKISNGEAVIADYLYGTYRLRNFSGSFDFRKYPLLKWQLQGQVDLGKDSNWKSQGQLRLDQQAGYISLAVKNALLRKAVNFIPRPFPHQIHSGWADIRLNFALAKEYFGIEKITAAIRRAKLTAPKFPKEFQINYLSGTFSPTLVRIKKAELLYGQTKVHISGTLDPLNSRVNVMVAAAGINLADWTVFIRKTSNFHMVGQAALKLTIRGAIRAPQLNGVITLSNTRMSFKEVTIGQIAGRMTITRNNLMINRLQGVWNDLRLEFTGGVKNLLDPVLNIKITSYGFRLQDLKWFQALNFNIKTEGDSVFCGALTGSIQNPQLDCLLTFQQLTVTQPDSKAISIQDVRLNFVWNPGSIRIPEAGGHLWDGQLALKGLITFEPAGIKWLISGKVSSLDLEKIPIVQPFPLKGKISTDMVLRGRWSQGELFTLGNVFGTFTGNRLNYSNATVEKADGVFSWNEGILTIDSIQAKINQGRVFGYLQLNRQSEISLAVNAEKIRVRDLFPDARQVPFDGIFNGSLDFKGPVDRMFGKIHGAFTNLTWDSKPIGNITGSIDYQDREFSITDLHIVTDLGNFSIKGKINTAARPVVDIRVTGIDTNLKGLANWLPIDPSIEIDGIGQLDLAITGNISNPNFQGQVKLTNPAFGIIKMQSGEITLCGNLDEITLTECRLRNEDFELELSGNVNRDRVDLKIAGHSFELSTLNFTTGGNSLRGLVDFSGRLSGPISHPVFTADVSGGHLSFGDLSYRTLKAELTWDAEGLSITQAECRQGNSLLALNGMILFGKPLAYKLELAVVACELSKLKSLIKIPRQFPVDGILTGKIKIDGPIDNPEIRIDGNLEGDLSGAPFICGFDLFYSQNKIKIDKIELNYENGVLLAQGDWENRRAINLRMQAIKFPLKFINQFVKPHLELSGTVNGEIIMQWNPGQVSGEWGIEVTNLNLNGNSFGNMQLLGMINDQGITLKNGVINGNNGTIRGHGFIPWPEPIRKLAFPVAGYPVSQMEGNLTVKNLPLTLINNYVHDISVMDGILNGDFRIAGDLSRPRISGRLDCVNGKASIVHLPLLVENFQASFQISNNNIRIRRARGTYGTGRFSLTGVIEAVGFKQLHFNLGLNGSRIYYKNQYFDGFGDLHLKMTGPINEPLISGDIVIFDARVGVLGVNSYKIYPSTWRPQFNLQIKAGANTRCRVIGLADLPVTGLVQFKGTLTEPALDGEMNSSNGVLTFYSSSFRIKKAKAVFKFSQGYYPYLELESSLRRAQVEVLLNIKGIAPDNISISLSSIPYMPQASIFRLLNWMALDNNQPLSPGDIISGNIGLVTDTIFEDLLYRLRQSLNVSYLYLEPDRQNNDFRINMGSYITQQMTYSFSRSIFPENKQSWSLSLSYYFNPNLALEYNYTMLNGVIWRLIYQIKL